MFRNEKTHLAEFTVGCALHLSSRLLVHVLFWLSVALISLICVSPSRHMQRAYLK
jgi:hypothetical protein